MDKSSVMFSSNTKMEDMSMVMQLLSINKNMENEKYIGLLIFVGRNKQRVFRKIKERMRARINGWNGSLLSQVGRAILLQSVIQDIQIYIMSYFLLPRSFIHDINMMMAGFWWKALMQRDRSIGELGIHYVSLSWMEGLVLEILRVSIWHS